MNKRISVDQAKKVACPVCLAPIGQLCTTTEGSVMRTIVHIGRRRALAGKS